ncbi:hypothetical protein [Staphylococcus aureus]|uniref:hypothetical protein n=1 Tax=Staphylococcus aureus TaxID=1280 RepID=UPI0020BE1D6B|nr:hypothetical protein [Staphylococcus aureus]
MAFKHEDFEIGSTVEIEMKKGKGDKVVGRVVDLYHAEEKQFATIVKQGSFFHNIVKLDDVKKVTVLK